MPDDLRHERLELDKQKTPDAPNTQERLGPEQSKADHDQTFFNRNFGVLITAATTILGISLSATQIWVAYIQSDREAQRRAYDNAAAQLEKSREFDFQESKDLREFVIKNYSQITSNKEDVRNNIRDLMISTYRPEIVTPIVKQLGAFSPKQQQATWGEAAVALAGFAARKPETAWCYQEKKPNGTYGVYCHSSEAKCTTAKQGSRTATACIQVSGLSETDWHLDRKQREGELVERGEVEEAAFASARRVRDALMNIPARVASLYAAETDPQKIHQNLEDEIRNVLIDLIGEKETSSKP